MKEITTLKTFIVLILALAQIKFKMYKTKYKKKQNEILNSNVEEMARACVFTGWRAARLWRVSRQL